jgi:hypothetical protein
MSTNQILIGIGLILALAVGSQVLASRLRVPALIVMLPAVSPSGRRAADGSTARLMTPCSAVRY